MPYSQLILEAAVVFLCIYFVYVQTESITVICAYNAMPYRYERRIDGITWHVSNSMVCHHKGKVFAKNRLFFSGKREASNEVYSEYYTHYAN